MTGWGRKLREQHERWVTGDRGASAVEYGLLIAGIAAIIVLVIFAFNDTITGLFDDTCESIGLAQGAPSTAC